MIFAARPKVRAGCITCRDLHLHLSVAIFETTSGQQFCWFQKKTRTGEDCEGKRRRFTPGMVRYVGVNADAWACTRQWTTINRASNSFCACPLPEHSGELHKQNIPVRFHALFDRVGQSVPGSVSLWHEMVL